MTAIPTPEARRRRLEQLLVCGVAVVAAWAYWPTLADLTRRWYVDPQYSHGFLVPAFAAFLLWTRRKELSAVQAKPTWWALPFFAAAAVLFLAGGYIYSPWAEQTSLLPALVGIVLAVWGWEALRLCWPAVAFLLFMVPLPDRLDKALAAPLQRVRHLSFRQRASDLRVLPQDGGQRHRPQGL